MMSVGERGVSLIVNADDFGLTRGVNRGIVETYVHGIVTSSTLMANTPHFQDAINLARDCPELDLGVHINLTHGRPVSSPSELKRIVNASGEFTGVAWLFVRAWMPGAYLPIRHEVAAQVERVMSAGVRISHIDAHKHAHVHPVVLRAVMSVAKEYGIRAIRAPVEDDGIAAAAGIKPDGWSAIRSEPLKIFAKRARAELQRRGFAVPDRFFGIAKTGHWNVASLVAVISPLKPGVTELMVHPGMVDDELRSYRGCLVEPRQRELDALVSTHVRKAVREASVRLVTFRSLGSSNGSTV